jgi:hypothetical protein
MHEKLSTPQDLRQKIESASVAIPSAKLRELCHIVALYYQQRLGLVVDILNICEFKITKETVG